MALIENLLFGYLEYLFILLSANFDGVEFHLFSAEIKDLNLLSCSQFESKSLVL